MNFKEALIAHLQGEKVEVKAFKHWEPLKHWVSRGAPSLLVAISDSGFGTACDFRLAPRTIRVNGVEVPAPEKDALTIGVPYYVPDPSNDAFCFKVTWQNLSLDDSWLARGLVYLTIEDAIARAKAMLLTH